MQVQARLKIEFCGMSVWQDPDRCEKCSRTINREQATLWQNQRPVRPFPLSVTSDGFFVCSEKFRKIIINNSFKGIMLEPLVNKYYVIKVKRKIAYGKCETLYQKQTGFCDLCQSFEESLIGLDRPPISKDEKPIDPLEIVESKLRIGSEYHPSRGFGAVAMCADMIVGAEVASVLRQSKLKGLRLEEHPIES